MENDRIATIESSKYSCQHVETCLDAYLEGEVSTREQFAVEKHLETCEKCRLLVTDLKEIIDTAATLANQPVPPGVRTRLRVHLEEQTGVRFSRPKPDLSIVK